MLIETACLKVAINCNCMQFAETHFAEFGKESLPCPFCRINFRQSGQRNSTNWASKFGKVGKAVVYICKNRLFESENIMWGISDVCTVTEACGTTSFQKNRPRIRSNLKWQIEHVLAKVPVKNQFRRRSKPPAETTEREHGV